MIKGVLFDLDGVLTDTAKYHFESWKLIAQDLGYNLSIEDNEKLKGVSRADSLDLIARWASASISSDQKTKFLLKKNEHYLTLIKGLSEEDILPGVVSFLDLLDEHNCLKGVGSSSKNAPVILERIGLKHRFGVVIDGNQVSKTKPDPEVFLKGSKELGVAPADCLVVEDAPSGVTAAKSAGMKVLGIGSSVNLVNADKTVNTLEGISWEDILSI